MHKKGRSCSQNFLPSCGHEVSKRLANVFDPFAILCEAEVVTQDSTRSMWSSMQAVREPNSRHQA